MCLNFRPVSVGIVRGGFLEVLLSKNLICCRGVVKLHRLDPPSLDPGVERCLAGPGAAPLNPACVCFCTESSQLMTEHSVGTAAHS